MDNCPAARASPDLFKTMIDVRNLLAILVLAVVWPVVETSLVLAQATSAIVPTTGAGSLGTLVTTSGHTVQITGGTRLGNGTNLFHSFGQFEVGSADTARFLNTTPSLSTANILSRVTGGNPSAIFGTIDTMSYPGANLFLMNPAGIVFGPNATLNVSGSVAFTTANYLRLAETGGSNSGIFHADPTATSLLTSTSVAAFGFLGSNPAAIAIQGSTLTVKSGQLLSLVGGNHGFTYTNPDTGVPASVPDGVTVTGGHLRAPEGQINIASVASPGEILEGTLDRGPNVSGQSFGTLGTVQISQQSTIDSSGEGGGTILIRGGRLVVDDSTISANTKIASPDTSSKVGQSGAGIDIRVTNEAVIDNGSLVETNVDPGANHESGGVRIAADHITISGGPKALAFQETNPGAEVPFGIRSNVGLGSTAAKSGDILLNASSSIQIKDHGDIRTETATVGGAGHITLNASGNIDIDSSNVSTRVSKDGSGISGNIRIDAQHGNILLTNANVFTATDIDGSTGTLGNILITAQNLQLLAFSKIGGDNNSAQTQTQTQTPNGDIVITLSGQLSLAGGSFINTGAFKSANSADLTISSPTVLITGKDSSGLVNSGLYTSTISSGNGGRLQLFTDNLKLRDGGVLFSSSFIGFEGEIPSGRGGSISIDGLKSSGPSITIDGPGSGIFASTKGFGASGTINVSAQSLAMTNGATITASSTGTNTSSSLSPGPGNITINAGQSLEMRDSSITTESEQTNGGNIDIRAIDHIQLVNSSISTSVPNGTGNGGNITIDPNTVILQNSKVLAQAVQGSGGNIMITTPLFLTDPRSVVDASSQFGLNGSVTIQSPTSNLSETVGQLASKTNPPQVLLQNRCVALAGGEQSTFILTGRDALPSQPGGWLSSPVAMEHWTGDKIEEHASGLMVRRVEPRVSSPELSQVQGTEVLSLRRLTPSGFLVRSFADRALTGCRS